MLLISLIYVSSGKSTATIVTNSSGTRWAPNTTAHSAGVVVVSTLCFESTAEIRDLVGNFLTFTEPNTQLVIHLNTASKSYDQAQRASERHMTWIKDRKNVHINPKSINVRWGTFSIIHAHLINAQFASTRLIAQKDLNSTTFIMQASNMFWVRNGMENLVRRTKCIAPFSDLKDQNNGKHKYAKENTFQWETQRNKESSAPPRWAIMTRATWTDHLRQSRGWALKRATQAMKEPMLSWATQNATIFRMGHEGFYASLADITLLTLELDKYKFPSPRTFAPEEILVPSWLGTRTDLGKCSGSVLLCFKVVRGQVLKVSDVNEVAAGRRGEEVFAVKRIPRLNEIQHGGFGGDEEWEGNGAPKVKVKNSESLAKVRAFVLNKTNREYLREAVLSSANSSHVWLSDPQGDE